MKGCKDNFQGRYRMDRKDQDILIGDSNSEKKRKKKKLDGPDNLRELPPLMASRCHTNSGRPTNSNTTRPFAARCLSADLNALPTADSFSLYCYRMKLT